MPKPGMKLRQVAIGAKKPWDQNNRGAVTVRHAQAIADRGGMQHREVYPTERFLPKRDFGVRLFVRG